MVILCPGIGDAPFWVCWCSVHQLHEDKCKADATMLTPERSITNPPTEHLCRCLRRTSPTDVSTDVSDGHLLRPLLRRLRRRLWRTSPQTSPKDVYKGRVRLALPCQIRRSHGIAPWYRVISSNEAPASRYPVRSEDHTEWPHPSGGPRVGQGSQNVPSNW